jgi:hypothetical protein
MQTITDLPLAIGHLIFDELVGYLLDNGGKIIELTEQLFVRLSLRIDGGSSLSVEFGDFSSYKLFDFIDDPPLHLDGRVDTICCRSKK